MGWNPSSSRSRFDFGWYDEGGFSSAPIFGGGVGYQFTEHLRGDLTVEWRGKSDFNANEFVIALTAIR